MVKAPLSPTKSVKRSREPAERLPKKRIPFEFHRGNALYAAAAATVGLTNAAPVYTTDTTTAAIKNPTAVNAAIAIVGAARLNTGSVYTTHYMAVGSHYVYYCFFTNDGLVVILSSDGLLYDTCSR